MLHVRHARQSIRKLRKVGNAAGSLKPPDAAEIFHQSNGVYGLLPFAELHHSFKNVTVLREEKILRAQFLDGGIQRVIVQQDGAQDASFRFQIVRQRTFDCNVSRGHELIRFIFAYGREKRKSPFSGFLR
jgi:hypothetical protein